MSQEKTTLEIIAPSVEEAVERGLSELGLAREHVLVDVLDTGSRGLFGLGSRQARIRLTIRPADYDEKMAILEDQSQLMVDEMPLTSEVLPLEAASDEEVVEGDENALHVAREVVAELLERMRIRAKVVTKYVKSMDGQDEPVIMVDIQGDDLSILIGKRSETLSALQYISSLIVGKELGRWTPMIIDVQGYRCRRERVLRQLARRMAEQAITTGRRQVLEPMPASERRVVHLELRNHPKVYTESMGEEPNRKVSILLKK